MNKLKIIFAVLSLLFLSSCIGALSDIKELEGDVGQGGSSPGCVYIADVLKVDSNREDRLEREMAPPGGGNPRDYGPFEYMMDFVQVKLTNAVQTVFNRLNSSGTMDTIIVYSFGLVILFYCSSMLLGFVSSNPYDVIMIILKFLIIYALATDYSTFATVVKDVFEALGEWLVDIISSAFANGKVQASRVDDMLSIFLSHNTMKFFYTLFSMELGAGWLYGITLAMFAWFFIKAMIRAIYVLIVAMIIRSLLFALAPLFLVTFLFNGSQRIFDGWVRQVANFTLMPVFLFAFMGFYFNLIEFFLTEAAQTKFGVAPKAICYGKEQSQPGDLFGQESWSLNFGGPGDKTYGFSGDVPLNLAPLLSLVVLSYVMQQMVNWAISLSGSVTQAFGTFSISGVPRSLQQQLSSATRGRSRSARASRASQRRAGGQSGDPDT